MFQKLLIDVSIQHPKKVVILSVLITIFFLAAFPNMTIDTDPVHMLPQDNPAIVLYEEMKKEFELNDLIVFGIDRTDGSSLFTVEGMTKVHKITREILEVMDNPPEPSWWRDIFEVLQFMKDRDLSQTVSREILVNIDVRAPSEIDDIRLNDKGELKVVPLMKDPPKTEAEAAAVLKAINENPIMRGKLASEDGSLVGIFLPLRPDMKDRSYYLGEEIKKITEKYLDEGEEFYLAGLPIAENTFGSEMFIQMGIFAPAAGMVIFILMFFFFRNLQLITGPMIIAMMSVIWAMGSLIYSGNTVHIMSSMIPVFLMPIALLDSIHIISHLHDRIDRYPSREEAVRAVIKDLFNPMLFTSLTTIVGFVSLASTGIPPVVVFGIAVGWGVGIAWFLSMTFIPAYCMLINEDSLRKSGVSKTDIQSPVMSAVRFCKSLTARFPGRIIMVSLGVVLISLLGLQKIIVNDNPVRWFKFDHPIRQADRIMNAKLAGTYLTNLIFELPVPSTLTDMKNLAEGSEQAVFDEDESFTDDEDPPLPSIKDGVMIKYIEKIEHYLESVKDKNGLPIVGGINSIVGILEKVGAIALNDPTVPDSREKVAQYMFLYESGDLKKGRDMWKFITRDGIKAQMCLLLKNGDNEQMNYLVSQLEWFISQPGNEPPFATLSTGEKIQLELKWSGLTYINSIWQDEMVKGMRTALMGSFVVVFLMMALLFRSLLWGLISMLPLSLTILFTYGLVGWTGKFYDMPIAVLSSLTLGLSIDFAIHFNQSFREIYQRTQNLEQTLKEIFEEPSRAIWRNVLVIAIGFTPMFFSGLATYVTVGAFFFVIMLISGITTLILLPCVIQKTWKWLPTLANRKEVQ